MKVNEKQNAYGHSVLELSHKRRKTTNYYYERLRGNKIARQEMNERKKEDYHIKKEREEKKKRFDFNTNLIRVMLNTENKAPNKPIESDLEKSSAIILTDKKVS